MVFQGRELKPVDNMVDVSHDGEEYLPNGELNSSTMSASDDPSSTHRPPSQGSTTPYSPENLVPSGLPANSDGDIMPAHVNSVARTPNGSNRAPRPSERPRSGGSTTPTSPRKDKMAVNGSAYPNDSSYPNGSAYPNGSEIGNDQPIRSVSVTCVESTPSRLSVYKSSIM